MNSWMFIYSIKQTPEIEAMMEIWKKATRERFAIIHVISFSVLTLTFGSWQMAFNLTHGSKFERNHQDTLHREKHMEDRKERQKNNLMR